MQIYALEKDSKAIHASHAERGKDYFCMECQGIVRLRGGRHKKAHFFHFMPTRACKQHSKGVIHLHLQNYLFELLPQPDCALEYRMPNIGRIADVVWFSQKIVFEIQCSPITAQEVEERNRAYGSLGWKVVWLLHEKRFNRFRVTAAEEALLSNPYYFTNMNEKGEGIIYDQQQVVCSGLRSQCQAAYPVRLEQPYFCPQGQLYFKGDFGPVELKKTPRKRNIFHWFKKLYLSIFNHLIEHS